MTTPPASRRALMLAAAWVGGLAVVLAWGLLLTHPLASSVGAVDDDVVTWLADRRTPGLDAAAEVGTFLGNTWFGIVSGVVLALGSAWWARSVRPAVLVVVVMGGVYAAYLVATALVPRDRPPVRILDPGLVPDHSFPSGHVATAVALYGCLALLLRRYAPAVGGWVALLLVLPLLVAAARLYQGAHHPTDVLTSLVATSAWVLAGSRWIDLGTPGGTDRGARSGRGATMGA